MLNKSRTFPTDELYVESKLFDIRQLYSYRALILQYKMKNQLKLIDHLHNTRYKLQHETQRDKASKTIGQRSFSFIAPRLYSFLPQNIKECKSKYSYKKINKNMAYQYPQITNT